jgi:hypothetical protein
MKLSKKSKLFKQNLNSAAIAENSDFPDKFLRIIAGQNANDNL